MSGKNIIHEKVILRKTTIYISRKKHTNTDNKQEKLVTLVMPNQLLYVLG